MNTDDIDAALAPLMRARGDLADRIGQLAAIAIARIIHLEVPQAAYADLAWTSEGDQAFLEPAGAFYDAGGTEIHVPDPIELETRLQQYCGLLDETNLGAWSDLVTEADADGRLHGEDIRRLDVAAALALQPSPPLPALPAWIALLEAAVPGAGGPITGEEAAQMTRPGPQLHPRSSRRPALRNLRPGRTGWRLTLPAT